MESRQKKLCEKSTFSAYVLLIENHLLPSFGNQYEIQEADVQTFVLQKLEARFKPKNHQRHFNRFENGAEIWC
jgi:hypothetical protein